MTRGPHNKDCKCTCCESSRGNVYNKGKTWEEYWSKEKAKEMREHLSRIRKGKPSQLKGRTYEEIYGNEEKIKKLRELRSTRMLGNSYSVGNRTRFCSGSNHPSWQGGKSFEPYDPDFNRDLKKQIRERDNYTCLICNKLENGRRHSIHHIDYNKKNNTIVNLVTLCVSCNTKVNYSRDVWTKVFVEIQKCRFYDD